MSIRQVRGSLAVVFTALLGLASIATADEVILDDGSRVQGRVLQLSRDTLSVETTFAGTISIAKAQVVGLTTEQPMAVSLKSGDRIMGRLAVVDGKQTITSATMGSVPIDLASVTAIFGPDSPTPRVREAQAEFESREAALKQQHEEEMAAIQARLDRVTPIWSGRIEVGLNGRTGNSERTNFNGRAEVKRETKDDRWFLYATVVYAEEDGSRTDNEIIGGSRLEVDLDESDRKFLFIRGELEYDEFEDLDLRTTVVGGGGYVLIKEDEFDLTLRAGLGYVHESFDDGTSDDQGVVELTYLLRWDINETFRLTHDLTYLPDVVDSPTERYRILSNTAIEMPIGTSEKWRLRAGVRNDYDSQPQGDTDRLDTWYFLNLAYDW